VYHAALYAPAHKHCRSLGPYARGPSTLALYFAFILPPPPSKSLRVESALSRCPSTPYMRAPPDTQNLPSSAVHASRGGHGRCFAFLRFVHPRQCTRSGRLRADLARAPSCLREMESLAAVVLFYISTIRKRIAINTYFYDNVMYPSWN
jgi:hypothetical protein